MLIYPNIVNMLGEMSIDINAMCLDRTQVSLSKNFNLYFFEFVHNVVFKL